MNSKRKMDLQEKKIKSLQSQVEKLKNENNVLLLKNEELVNKVLQLQQQLEVFEEVRSEYEACIKDANYIKEYYQQTIAEAQHLKIEYSNKFKQLLKRIK